MHWVETLREAEIDSFVESLRDRNSPYKHMHMDPRRGQGFPGRMYELFAEPGEALEDCLAELWRRMLTDGRDFADGFQWGLRVVDDGFVWSDLAWNVRFADTDDEAPMGVIRVGIGGAGFAMHVPGLIDAPYLDDESSDQHECEILRRELAVYEAVRNAAQRPEVMALWQETIAGRTISVRGSVRDGGVDLQIGQLARGPLPEYDQRLLDGHPDPGGAIGPVQPLYSGTVPYDVVRGTAADETGM